MPTLTTELLQQEIDYVLANDDWQGAFEAYSITRDWLAANKTLKSNSREYAQYQNLLMKLKFLSLNYFDDVQDYYDLLKNYLPLALEMPDYDLWGRLSAQLTYLPLIESRDTFKAKLREALEHSDSLLLNRQKYPQEGMPYKVGDWIKDFVANLGLDNFDKLKKVEYLEHGKYIKLLKPEDKEKIKVLLNVYENLKLSSRTPVGYDNAVAMNIDGKQIIFDHGQAEEVLPTLLEDIKKLSGEAPAALAPAAAPAAPAVAVRPSSQSAAPASAPADPIAELEKLLAEYPSSSLEHKAIKQEINRLKVAAFKAAQQSKTNVKK
ncbi:MAG: hypothetical protein WC453_00415 [Patescibacteria group bacterium]